MLIDLEPISHARTRLRARPLETGVVVVVEEEEEEEEEVVCGAAWYTADKISEMGNGA